jgi:hypothetical protein
MNEARQSRVPSSAIERIKKRRIDQKSVFFRQLSEPAADARKRPRNPGSGIPKEASVNHPGW